MKRPRIGTYCFLSTLLVGILACAGCSDIAQLFKPAHRTVPPECIASASICAVRFNSCNASPNPDPASVPPGYVLIWRKPQDGHTYSIHFKARTPVSANVVPAETPSQPVTGDSQCSKPTTDHDTNCYFPYYLNQDDTSTKCSDPGIQVVPN